MMDVDSITDLDQATGLPQLSAKPWQQRWLEALDEGPDPEIKHQQQTPKDMKTDSSKTKATQIAEPNKTKQKTTPKIVRPEEVDLALLEQVLTRLGCSCDWPQRDMLLAATETCRFLVQIIDQRTTVLLSAFVELTENLPPLDALRFANRLNDGTFGARFKFIEPSTKGAQCSSCLPLDTNPLWVEVELTYEHGLVPAQLAKAATHLTETFEETIGLGVEQGVIDEFRHYEEEHGTRNHN
jgi:hypothetical protein